jgi:hypothetical protein
VHATTTIIRSRRRIMDDRCYLRERRPPKSLIRVNKKHDPPGSSLT